MDAKIATIFEYPNKFLLLSKNLCSGSLKIAIQHPKISVRYLKISGLKISVDSLKIAGLKIIARVCVCACMYVRSHFAEVSKIAQDAPRAGTQAPERHRTQEHKRPPQEPKPERDQSERTSAGTRARAYKKKLQKQ